MLVREVIDHGDYHKVRTIEIDPSEFGVVGLLASSPYAYRKQVGDPYVRRILSGLLSTGTAEHGWSTFTQEALMQMTDDDRQHAEAYAEEN
jgi:hypothetical protein